jgi:hypothetical protein
MNTKADFLKDIEDQPDRQWIKGSLIHFLGIGSDHFLPEYAHCPIGWAMQKHALSFCSWAAWMTRTYGFSTEEAIRITQINDGSSSRAEAHKGIREYVESLA